MRIKNLFLPLVLGVALGIVCNGFAWLAMTFLPASVHYTVTETYRFSTEDETDVTLGIFLPKDGPYQTVSSQKVDWTGSVEERDAGSIKFLILRGILQPGTHEANITYTAKLKSGTARWEADVDPITLQPQPRIESNHPEVQAAAINIGEGTSRQIAYEIFKYVSKYFTLPTRDVLGGSKPTALSALQSGVGGCDHHSHLMVGLLRARGIPSRVVCGLSFSNSLFLPYGPSETKTWNHPGGSHAWVEVFTGERWEFAEPTWAKSFIFAPWRYFGRGTGSHLFYGDAEDHEILYQHMFEEVNLNGQVVGAMSGPLRFVAAVSTDDVDFTPLATVKKGWDGRFFNGIMVFILVLIPGLLLIRRLRKVE